MKLIPFILAISLLSAASCEKTVQKKPTTTAIKVEPATTPESKNEEVPDLMKPVDVGPEAPAIYFIAGLKGYTEPCGCTLDIKLGGIDRIVAYFEDTKAFHPERITVHVGDLLFENEVAKENQPAEEARVDLIVNALKKLKVAVSVPGPKDFALGVDFFRATAQKAEVKIIAQNMSLKGKPLPSSALVKMGNKTIGFVGIAEEKKFIDVKNIKLKAPDTKKALKEIASADVKVLLASGDEIFGRKYTKGFDFVVIGQPRETDQTDLIDGAWTLEPYDQGRYIGALKVYNTDKKGSFENANKISKSALEKIEKQLLRVEKQIDDLGGEKSEFLTNLQNKKKGLEDEKVKIKSAKLEISTTNPSFIWQAVAMDTQFRNDEEFEQKRKAYNKELKKLSGMVERSVVAVKPGEAEFVGNAQCMTCHVNQGEAWQATRHGDAFATLEKRDKDYDHKCVGCHVVGYEKPGGSVIGKFTYEADITHGDLSRTIKKELKNVGCENCHGPGSKHILQPVGENGPMNIYAKPTVDACMQCHVPDHSPKFDFDTYIKKIVVPGHGLPK